MAETLLDYWSKLPWQWASTVNEDNVAIQWAYENNKPIYQTIPALVRHDTSVNSTLGYDHHDYRRPSVPWTDEPVTDPSYWQPRGMPPLVKNPWATEAQLAFIKNFLDTIGRHK
jgi:hypothetical protein